MLTESQSIERHLRHKAALGCVTDCNLQERMVEASVKFGRKVIEEHVT